MKQIKNLCHCNPQTLKNKVCRSKGYVILRKVNDICIAPQHITKSDVYKNQAKNRKEFIT